MSNAIESSLPSGKEHTSYLAGTPALRANTSREMANALPVTELLRGDAEAGTGSRRYVTVDETFCAGLHPRDGQSQREAANDTRYPCRASYWRPKAVPAALSSQSALAHAALLNAVSRGDIGVKRSLVSAYLPRANEMRHRFLTGHAQSDATPVTQRTPGGIPARTTSRAKSADESSS